MLRNALPAEPLHRRTLAVTLTNIHVNIDRRRRRKAYIGMMYSSCHLMSLDRLPRTQKFELSKSLIRQDDLHVSKDDKERLTV